MPDLHRNLIGGEWVAGASATANRNPSRRARRDRRVRAGRRGADARRDRRREDRRFPAGRRARSRSAPNILDRVGTEILARKDELGRLLSREEGKTLPEGIGEAARAGHIFKFFAGEVLRLTGDKVPSVRPGIDVEVTREPIGVVGLITPWNFPIAIPAWKIAPALAYGNTVVFKPADLVPGCAWALADILARAGIPAGVFNLVMGRGSVVGEALVNDPDVAAISFTGSVGTGRGDRGQGRRADGEGAARDGRQEPARRARRRRPADRRQRRDAGRVLLDRPALHGVVAAHRHRGHPRPFRRGDDRQAEDAQGRRRAGARAPTSGRSSTRASSSRTCATSRSARARARSSSSAASGSRARHEGYYLSPALFTGADNAMRIAREEIFGPVACVIRAQGLRRGAGARQRHRVRPVQRASSPRRSSTRRTSSGTRRRGW